MTSDHIIPDMTSSNDDNVALPWFGTLQDHHLEDLKQKFGNVIIEPGQSLQRSRIDQDGKMCIPGSVGGITDARRRLGIWFDRDQKGETKWWIDHLQDKNVEPLRIRDLLAGLESSRWQKYKKVHDRISNLRRARRYRTKLFKKAIERADLKRQEESESAAQALVNLNHLRSRTYHLRSSSSTSTPTTAI